MKFIKIYICMKNSLIFKLYTSFYQFDISVFHHFHFIFIFNILCHWNIFHPLQNEWEKNYEQNFFLWKFQIQQQKRTKSGKKGEFLMKFIKMGIKVVETFGTDMFNLEIIVFGV